MTLAQMNRKLSRKNVKVMIDRWGRMSLERKRETLPPRKTALPFLFRMSTNNGVSSDPR